jgi:hypothetical protein
MSYELVWDRSRADEGLIFNNSILMINGDNDNLILIDRTNHEVLMVIENAGNCILTDIAVDNPEEFIMLAKLAE